MCLSGCLLAVCLTVRVSAQRPDEDWLHHSKQHLQASLDFAVAGRAATELAFEAGGVTAGATDDFKQATSLARAMVTQYGMSDNLGTSSLEFASDTPAVVRQCVSSVV